MKEKRDVVTSLISISYAEGLLDAIRLLKLVDFNWHRDGKKNTGINLNKTVLATGAFDLLHYGHLKFLQESKKAGGKLSKLVVVIARDETVKERKGAKPVLPENQRRALVEAMKPVDTAILGSKDFTASYITHIYPVINTSVGKRPNFSFYNVYK